jgi:hypothetical protein
MAKQERFEQPTREAGDFLVEDVKEFAAFEWILRWLSDGAMQLANWNVSPAGPGGDAAGDAIQPTGDIPGADGSGFSSENEEDGLEGVLGEVLVAQLAPAHAQDHRTVAPDEQFEGVLISVGNESPQQLRIGVRHVAGDALSGAQEPLQNAAKSWIHGKTLLGPVKSHTHTVSPMDEVIQTFQRLPAVYSLAGSR